MDLVSPLQAFLGWSQRVPSTHVDQSTLTALKLTGAVRTFVGSCRMVRTPLVQIKVILTRKISSA
jgi:hypothetical protein